MNDAVLRSALGDCLKALQLEFSAKQVDTLLVYLELLQRWNEVYNLTAVRDPASMLSQHLADCLAAVAPLREKIGVAPATLLDVGSGAGLPAVVFATALPSLEVTSVDAVGKKVAFVRQAAAELALTNLRAEQARVETMKAGPFDVVASRAFASLSEFVRLTERLLRADGRWLAMKARVSAEELDGVPTPIDVFHVEPVAVPGLEAERCIVWMRRRADAGRSL